MIRPSASRSSAGVKEGDRLLVGPAQAITPGTPLELQGAGSPKS